LSIKREGDKLKRVIHFCLIILLSTATFIGVNAAALVSFSARNVPVRDAFATLARISGKSITVSGEIQDRQMISVVEIKEQPFNEAFMSLVRAAGVDFVVRGDSNFTILRANSRSDVRLFSSLESSDIDLTKPLEERAADLTYDNEDVSNILKDIANRYGVDIILTAQPTERVTVKLKKATLNDALTLILSGSQFKFTKSGDAYVIYNSSNKNFSLYNDTAFIPLNFLDAAEIIKLLPDELKKLAKSSEKQNALVADGSMEDIKKLKAFILAVDQPIPQVELDVKLVELSEKFGRSINPYQQTFGLGRIGRFVPNLSTSAADDLISGGFNLNLGADEFQIFNSKPTLSQNSSNAQIKVSQRLLVTSGKSAQINFDQDVNVLLNAASGTGGGTSIAVQTQQIQRITAGNSLNITPIVGHGGVITVQVEVEVSANGDVNPATGIPVNTTRRKIKSEVQIPNHRTIVIGGIFDDQKTRSANNQVPVLSKLPIIGQLFGNSSKSKNQTELIILITPHVKNADKEEIQQYFPTT
jgi:type IV pilus assembly protein PilQ